MGILRNAAVTGTRRLAGSGIPKTLLKTGEALAHEVTEGAMKGQFLLPGFTRNTGKAGSSAMKGVIGRGLGTRISTSTPPFKASSASGSRFAGGDPRAQVTGLARREELSMKAKVADRKTRAKIARGEATRQRYKYKSEAALRNATENNDVDTAARLVRRPVHGPNTKGQQQVDDLFFFRK